MTARRGSVRWWTRLRCRLTRHRPTGFTTRGNFDSMGRPRNDGWFTVNSRCGRCGADTSRTMPSQIAIVRES